MKMQITAMGTDIVFQFEQGYRHVGDGSAISQAFQETTESGITFHQYGETTSSPRWGNVIAVGPTVKEDIKVGDRILIEPLKWTNHTVYDEQQYWKTNEDFVLGVDEDAR